MDNLTPAEQAEYDRIKRNLAEAKAFCDRNGIDQLAALGLRSNKYPVPCAFDGCSIREAHEHATGGGIQTKTPAHDIP